MYRKPILLLCFTKNAFFPIHQLRICFTYKKNTAHCDIYKNQQYRKKGAINTRNFITQSNGDKKNHCINKI